jgi:hypothetical protein
MMSFTPARAAQLHYDDLLAESARDRPGAQARSTNGASPRSLPRSDAVPIARRVLAALTAFVVTLAAR